MKKRKEKTGNGRTPIALVSGVLNSRRRYACPACLVRQAFWLAVWVSAVLLALAPCSTAKEKKKVSRTVTGIVLDQGENPVVGAAVELSDVQTGKKVAIYTEDGGRYQFSDLQRTHDYEIQASLKGKSSEVRKVSSLDTRNTIVLNLKISPPQQ